MATKSRQARGASGRPQAGSGAAPGGLPQTIAWQGVSFDAPAAWSLVSASGDDRAGSLRAELTGEAERIEAALGIELRWSQIKTEQTAEMLDRRIKPILTTAERSAKRVKRAAETSVASISDRGHPERGTVREFFWSAEMSALGRIWRCSECGRLMVAQVYGTPGSRYQSRAREILAGLRCHAAHRGWTRWSLYGLDVQVPSEFKLTGQQLMTVYLELRFAKARGTGVAAGELLTVEQWSAANVQLKDAYLDEWLDRKATRLQRAVEPDKSELAMNGHAALEMTGKRSGVYFWLGDALKQLASMQKPACWYVGYAWECADSNKVYLIQQVTALREKSVARAVAERTVCHRPDDDSESDE